MCVHKERISRLRSWDASRQAFRGGGARSRKRNLFARAYSLYPVSAFYFFISFIFRNIPVVPNYSLHQHFWAPPKKFVHCPQFPNSAHSQNASSFPPFQLVFVPPPPWLLLAPPLPLSMEPPTFYSVHASPTLAVPAPSIQSRKEFPETFLLRALSLASVLLMQKASSAAQGQYRGHKWWQRIRLRHSPGAVRCMQECLEGVTGRGWRDLQGRTTKNWAPSVQG